MSYNIGIRAAAAASASAYPPNNSFEFKGIRPEYSLTAAVPQQQQRDHSSEPHIGSYVQEERLCYVFPLFNLRHPRDFKSTISLTGSLNVIHGAKHLR